MEYQVLTMGAKTGSLPRPRKNYLNESHGFMSWAGTLDHKRIGIMYLVGVLTAFLMGGCFALLIRLTLLTPTHMLFGSKTPLITAEQYNRVFTLHGAIMVFLFIIPAIPASLGNFVLPLMLGAKDVAFPRLNLASFYLWCHGRDYGRTGHGAGGGGHRLDLLHAVFDHHRRTGDADDGGGVRARVFVDLHGIELHRHHA